MSTPPVPMEGAFAAMLDTIATDDRPQLGHLRDSLVRAVRARSAMLAAADSLRRAEAGLDPRLAERLGTERCGDLRELAAGLARDATFLEDAAATAAARTARPVRQVLAELPREAESPEGELRRACALILLATSGTRIAGLGGADADPTTGE